MDRNGAQQHLEVSCGGSDLARLLCLTRCCLQMVAVFIESSCPVSGPRPCDSCRSRVQLSIVSSFLKNNFQLLLRTQNLFFGILADQFMPRRQSSPPIHGGWRQRVLSLVEGLCWEGQDSKAKRHSFNLLAVGHRTLPLGKPGFSFAPSSWAKHAVAGNVLWAAVPPSGHSLHHQLQDWRTC